jgi:hypothetical protein
MTTPFKLLLVTIVILSSVASVAILKIRITVKRIDKQIKSFRALREAAEKKGESGEDAKVYLEHAHLDTIRQLQYIRRALKGGKGLPRDPE